MTLSRLVVVAAVLNVMALLVLFWLVLDVRGDVVRRPPAATGGGSLLGIRQLTHTAE